MLAFRSGSRRLAQTTISCLVDGVGIPKYAAAFGIVNHYSKVSSPDQRLAGQVAIITGGASGIGEQTARVFTEHGARVVIADIQAPSKVEKLLKELGPQAEYVQCDVTKEEDIVNAWEKAYSLDNKLDIVFNNAGILGTFSTIDKLRIEEFEATMAVNLRAMVLGTKHGARLMIPAKKGSILCTASTASVMGGLGPLAYSISKCGVAGLVTNAAADLRRHGIRVNAISPSIVATPLVASYFETIAGRGEPMSMETVEMVMQKESLLAPRWLTTVDVANAALYLASDMAGFVSGHNLVLDAGSTTSVKPVVLDED